MDTLNQAEQAQFDNILDLKQYFDYVYNYDDILGINKVSFRDQSYSLKDFLQIVIKMTMGLEPTNASFVRNSIDQFQNMNANEKVIIFKQFSGELYKSCYGKWYTSVLIITNHGKYIWMVFDDKYYIFKFAFTDYQLWIPADYIKIMQTLIDNYALINDALIWLGQFNQPPSWLPKLFETLKKLSSDRQDKVKKLEYNLKSEIPKWFQEKSHQQIVSAMPTTQPVPMGVQSGNQFGGYSVQGYSGQSIGASFDNYF